jgi:hypothetical protein
MDRRCRLREVVRQDRFSSIHNVRPTFLLLPLPLLPYTLPRSYLWFANPAYVWGLVTHVFQYVPYFRISSRDPPLVNPQYITFSAVTNSVTYMCDRTARLDSPCTRYEGANEKSGTGRRKALCVSSAHTFTSPTGQDLYQPPALGSLPKP